MHRNAAALTAILAALTPGVCPAAEAAGNSQQPLWEFGMGMATVAFADYRGADTSRVLPVPLPYFIYRGKFLRADRDGVRGRLFDQDVVELNVSVSATTPVRSRNSSARSGMPDLRPTIEFGPAIDVHLWRAGDKRARLDLRLPLRNAFTIESHPRSIGWFAAPNLNLDIDEVASVHGLSLGLLAGPLFASRRYDDYFYSVAPQYATAIRPAYEARGGFAGTQALAALSRRFPRYWVGAFVRHDTLSGAVFADSPLVHSKSYWAAGIGIAWMIGQSTRMVDTGGDEP